MSQIKHICIISGSYPTPTNPVSTFVHQLVCAWADLGIKCTVISPQGLSSYIKSKPIKPRKWLTKTNNGNVINIYSPRFLSFSNKKILGYSTGNITYLNFRNAVDKEIKRLKVKFDIFYGHFISPSGFTAAYLGEKYNASSFLANGESSTKLFDHMGIKKTTKLLRNLSGIVAVSSENKNRLIKLGIYNKENIAVFPNAIDSNLFYKRNKIKMRKKFGCEEDDFIVSFVGHFNDRKGSERLSKALDELDGVKSIFVGSGPKAPTCDGILYKGKMKHENIPEMLSATDAFVLPTLNEGCCNAIIEAIACGLPIISSDRPFNDDILKKDNSIRIDPNNIDEIKEAIVTLKNNNLLRTEMSEASLKQATNLNIENRAKNILKFMETKQK